MMKAGQVLSKNIGEEIAKFDTLREELKSDVISRVEEVIKTGQEQRKHEHAKEEATNKNVLPGVINRYKSKVGVGKIKELDDKLKGTRSPNNPSKPIYVPRVLTDEQKETEETILSFMEKNKGKVMVIEGVAGSGKSSVLAHTVME